MNNHSPLKIIFAGTPDFATPSLEEFAKNQNFLISAVITQPDKPVGRKQILTPPPVKEAAEKIGIPVWQLESLRSNPELEEKIKKLSPDLLVVVAYGQIIPQSILDLFKYGAVNLHPSLLPLYRGSSPIQSPILAGDKKTGVSIMAVDAKMDHGPILAQETIELHGTETGEILHDLLASIGAELLPETVIKLINKKIIPQEQAHDQATFCKTINKDDGKINWNETAENIERKIRAYHSWPGTWTMWDKRRLKIFPPVKIIETQPNLKTGEVFSAENGLAVKCGNNAIILNSLQIEGKSKLSVEEFLRGNSDIIKSILR